MADTNQRPRGGMTLDAIFRQGVFPPWPEKFRDVSPTGWVGQIWRERQAALKIAQVCGTSRMKWCSERTPLHAHAAALRCSR